MLDKILPAYLLTLSGVTSSPIGQNVFRNRTPEAAPHSYIVVGDARDIDIGQVVQGNLDREVGTYSIIVVTNKGFNTIDSAVDTIITALKEFKNGYIPSGSTLPRMWVQCFIIKDRKQFNFSPKDGGEETILGYIIPVKAAYDRIVSS